MIKRVRAASCRASAGSIHETQCVTLTDSSPARSFWSVSDETGRWLTGCEVAPCVTAFNVSLPCSPSLSLPFFLTSCLSAVRNVIRLSAWLFLAVNGVVNVFFFEGESNIKYEQICKQTAASNRLFSFPLSPFFLSLSKWMFLRKVSCGMCQLTRSNNERHHMVYVW